MSKGIVRSGPRYTWWWEGDTLHCHDHHWQTYGIVSTARVVDGRLPTHTVDRVAYPAVEIPERYHREAATR